MKSLDTPATVTNSSEKIRIGPKIVPPLSPHQEQLLTRIFAGHDSPRLEDEFGMGRSSARIFVVRFATGAPVIAKIGSVRDIEREMAANKEYATLLPSSYHIQIIAEDVEYDRRNDCAVLIAGLAGSQKEDSSTLTDFYTQYGGGRTTDSLKKLFDACHSRWWGLNTTESRLLAQDYDRLLPVHLFGVETHDVETHDVETHSVEKHRSTQPQHTLRSAELSVLDLSKIKVGQEIVLQGFEVAEISSLNLTLHAIPRDELEPVIRVRLVNPSAVDSLEVGHIITELCINVQETRTTFLQNQLAQVADSVVAESDLAESDLADSNVTDSAIAGETSLPAKTIVLDGVPCANPLRILQKILFDERYQIKYSTIHGDLNLGNILLEKDLGFPWLIDFDQTGPGPTLLDFQRLEVEFIAHLLPDELDKHQYPAAKLVEILHALHRDFRPTHFHDENLQDFYTVLRFIRERAQQYLFKYKAWDEYYRGFVIALLGALKFNNLHATSRLLVSLAAATITELIDTPLFKDHIDHAMPTEGAILDLKPIAPAPGHSPYMGLDYFDVADAHLFYGRKNLIAKLVGYLRTHQFLALVGASGSGKSSLARAGVVAALQTGEILADGQLPPSGSPNWPVHLITPTAHPLNSLAASLTRDENSITAAATLRDDLKNEPDSLHLYASRLLAGRGDEPRLLLVIDQFEELFTLCQNEREQQAFVDAIIAATIEQPGGPVTVMLTMRADFYAHCAHYPRLWSALESWQMNIGPMTNEELHEAIEVPALRNGWSLEEGLVDLLLLDIGEESGALPLLSHALLRTWEERSGHTMTFAGYQKVGGARGAIAMTAEAVYQSLQPYQQRLARNIFVRLTKLGEGTQDTRRRASLDELIPQSEPAREIEMVLKILADNRLVTTDEEVVDVAHEALIREWPRLRNWLDKNREALQIHRHLTEAAQEWYELACDPDLLYRGARLAQVEEWVTHYSFPEKPRTTSPKAEMGQKFSGKLYQTDLNDLEMDFLHTSRLLLEEAAQEEKALRQRELAQANALAEEQRLRAETEEQARVTLQKRAWLLAGAVLLALMAALIAVIFARISSSAQTAAEMNAQRALLSEENANAQAAISRAHQYAAFSANALNEHDVELALLLAAQAEQWAPIPEALSAAANALAFPWHSRVFYGHTNRLRQALWSADESKILTFGDDKIARIWDVQSGKQVVAFTGHTGPLLQAEWTMDESRVLTRSSDQTVRIWDAQSGEQLVLLAGHTKRIRQAAWNADESSVLTASDDQTARVWDAQSGEQLALLAGHTKRVQQAVWHADGSKIVTSSDDQTVRIWDAQSGEQLALLAGHDGPVMQVRWSADGRKILSGSWDNSARVWDAANGEELLVLAGHQGYLLQVEWSHDESKILTRSADKSVRIWDAENGETLAHLLGHDGPVVDAKWSVDGTKILTYSSDKTARVWDVASGEEVLRLPHKQPLLQAKWSVDETQILTSDESHALYVWDAETGEQDLILRSHADPVTQAEWSSDATRILTVSDQALRVWSNESASEVLQGHEATINGVTWNAAQAHILTSSDDFSARVWDFRSGQQVLVLQHDGPVMHARWNRSESRILTSSEDGTARIWDAESGEEQIVFAGHDGAASGIEWHENTQQILTYSDDGSIRIWDAQSGDELVTLFGHIGAIKWLRWNDDLRADGANLYTYGEDDTFRSWNTVSGEQVNILTIDEDAEQIEWKEFVSGAKILTFGAASVVHILDVPNEPVSTNRMFSNILRSRAERAITLRGHTASIQQAKWNKSGSRVVTASDDGTVRIWDAESGQQLLSFSGHVGRVLEVSWSNDEGRLLTTGDDGSARVWDAQSGLQLVIMREHTDVVWHAEWSKDNGKVLTVSNDKTVRVWSSRDGVELFVLAHDSPIRWATWNKNESHVFAIGQDHAVRILPVGVCAKVPRNFTKSEWLQFLYRYYSGIGQTVNGYIPTCRNAPIPPDAATLFRTY